MAADGTVTIHGIGCGLRDAGCELSSYVIGISPTPTARVGLLTIATNRSFLKRWVVPHVEYGKR